MGGLYPHDHSSSQTYRCSTDRQFSAREYENLWAIVDF
jgi:hypothetical protein